MVRVTNQATLTPEQKRLASMVFENSKNAILITDAESNIILVNPVFTTITGYTYEEVLGKNPKILKSGKNDRTFYQNLWYELTHNDYWQGTIWNRRKNGEIFPEWQTIHAVRDKSGKINHFFAIFSDLTDNKSLTEKVQQLKNYDPLTKLPNKNLFVDRLTVATSNLNLNNHKLAVLMLNINGFKKVNDAYGMPVGDIVLKTVAKRVRNVLRSDATLSRIAGDNYLILQLNIKDEADVLLVAKRVLNTFKHAFKLKKNTIRLDATIGVVIAQDDSSNAEILIKQSDLAMEKAKDDKTTHIAFFDSSLDRRINRRLSIESDLYKALEKNEFLLYYQPQISIKTGKIEGAEVLLRWNNPKEGLLLPGAFIDVALDSGLILPIDEWVLKTACAQSVTWQNQGLPPVRIAVNISALQFRQQNFAQIVQKIIHDSKINPGQLELELTEQIVLHNVSSAVEILEQFNAIGVKISLDDFGTGYSSLSYLSKLPISELKIDISFVRQITESRNSKTIAKTIILLAKGLGIKSLAEGVETKEQFEILRELGCDEIQGYYFSKPMPADQFAKMIHEEK